MDGADPCADRARLGAGADRGRPDAQHSRRPPTTPTPQRARYDSATDKLQLLGACFDEQRQPLVIGGETLLMRVTARDGLPFASKLRPPRIFIASVSRAADPVILDADHFRPLNTPPTPGATLDLMTAIPIEPVEDEVRLFVVATRDPQHRIVGAAGGSAQASAGPLRRRGIDDDREFSAGSSRRGDRVSIQGYE